MSGSWGRRLAWPLVVVGGLAIVAAVLARLAALVPPTGPDARGDSGGGSAATYGPVGELQARIDAGEVELAFEAGSGYLRAALDALDVPVESQILVFSKTSLQRARIDPENPRAIYFNDSLAVAWVPGGFIEIAALDAERGALFHVLEQKRTRAPGFRNDGRCARCHFSNAALGTNGFLVRSIPTAFDGTGLRWLGNGVPNHTTPLEERWGGWYVTGDANARAHLGNLRLEDNRAAQLPKPVPPILDSLDGRVDTSRYLSAHSDIVALLVFEHQMHMMNLLIRLREIAEETLTAGEAGPELETLVERTVDYMLFIDEAEIGRVRGSSAFRETFAARGPRDARGRSLRDLSLDGRLVVHPCSYMIYTQAFERLPATAKDAVYARLWHVLSGADADPRYARLTRSDRGAIVEILLETKRGLPDYFGGPIG